MADSDRFPPPRTSHSPQESPNLGGSVHRASAGRPYSLGFSGAEMGSSGNNGKRSVGIPPFYPNVPPASPNSQVLTSPFSRSAPQSSPGHSRSLSQPSGFFPLDALPPLSPSLYKDVSSVMPQSEQLPPDVAMEDQTPTAPPARPIPSTPTSLPRSNSGRGTDGLPPRKSHRRSHSDVPLAISDNLVQLLGPHPPLPPRPQADGFALGKLPIQQGQLVKREWEWDVDFGRGGNSVADRKVDADCGDDLFDEYMNFDSLDPLDSSEAEEKREDMDSRASGTKTSEANSSENDSECSVNENTSSGGQVLRKRSPTAMAERMNASGGFCAGDLGNGRNSRHCRSISMDSFMGKMDFSEDLLKLPPSCGIQSSLLMRNNSLDGTQSNFSLEIGNGGFSGTELKKIMANAKLAEIAMSDPKRAKRILANRQSAARSKERKMRYISELEHKVQTLQTEATTLSAQLTILQRDSAGLTSQNNELKFRLHAMEQQAHLRDALHEALTAEVQRLRLATAQLSDGRSLKTSNPQLAINSQSFQLHHQLLRSQQSMFQSQPQQQSQQEQQQRDLHQQNQSVSDNASKSC